MKASAVQIFTWPVFFQRYREGTKVMAAKNMKINALIQNIILGTITGLIVGYNLRLYFSRVGGAERAWLAFILIGPLFGFLSGIERSRYEKLRREKRDLETDMEKIQNRLKKVAGRYRLLIENATDAIFLTTVDGRFILFNEATCLLSGYKAAELKKMKISDLTMNFESGGGQQQAYLDNSIYRYEEKWKSRSGKILFMDVNTKWILLGDTRFILHIARDVAHSREADREEKSRQLQVFHESKTLEVAAAQIAVLKWMLHSARRLEAVANALPEGAEGLDEATDAWKQAKGLLQLMIQKFQRDMDSNLKQYNINDIITQELHYLDMIKDTQGLIKHMSLAPDLPNISVPGRDISIVVSLLFKAFLESVAGLRKKELYVNTKYMDKEIVVEMMAPQGRAFRDSLCSVMDPGYLPGDGEDHDRMNQTLAVFHLIVQAFRGKIDLGQNEKDGVLIRMKVPASAGQPVRNEGKETPSVLL